MRPATRRIAGLCSILASVGIAACARYRELEGGPPDAEPPQLVRVTPADSSFLSPGMPKFEMEWSEPVSASSVREAIRLHPPLRVGQIEVSGRRVRIALADSVPPDTTVVLVLGRRIQDRPPRNNKRSSEIHLVYTTGASVQPTATVLGKVTTRGRTEANVVVGWTPVPEESLAANAQRGLPRCAVDADGLFQLHGVPFGRRFRLVAFADRNENLVADAGEIATAFADTLQLASGEVRRGVAWTLVDPKEPGRVTGVAQNRTAVAGPVAVALRLLASGGDVAAGPDTTSVRADSLRPRTLAVVRRDSTAWESAYAALEPRGFRRGEWRVVYASPRGDYSVSVPPGQHALVAFVEAERDSAPGLFIGPDSTHFDWEPLYWGGQLEVEPGAQLRLRSIEIGTGGGP